MPVRPDDVCQFLDRTGWSQARLAWELGINQPRISRFLNGMKKPSPDLVRVLEAFFATDALACLPVHPLRASDDRPRADGVAPSPHQVRA